MARCGCTGPTACGCAIIVTECINISGDGTPGNPWEIGLDTDPAGAIVCGVNGVGVNLASASALAITANGLHVARNSWVGGTLLARAVRTTNDTAKSAVADITGMSITFTLTQTRWVLFLASVFGLQNTSTGNMQLYLTDSSNNILKQGVDVVGAAGICTLEIIYPIQLAPGTYTYKLRMTTTAGTVTPTAATTELMNLSAYEMGA